MRILSPFDGILSRAEVLRLTSIVESGIQLVIAAVQTGMQVAARSWTSSASTSERIHEGEVTRE